MRRTKEELNKSNYYEWLAEKNRLQAKKKSGEKLSKEEKAVVRLNPTPDKPYVSTRGPAALLTVKKEEIKLGNLPSKDVEFVCKGGSFVCTVIGGPRTDEDCMLFCEVEGCPFFSKGYFRTKGLKF